MFKLAPGGTGFLTREVPPGDELKVLEQIVRYPLTR